MDEGKGLKRDHSLRTVILLANLEQDSILDGARCSTRSRYYHQVLSSLLSIGQMLYLELNFLKLRHLPHPKKRLKTSGCS